MTPRSRFYFIPVIHPTSPTTSHEGNIVPIPNKKTHVSCCWIIFKVPCSDVLSGFQQWSGEIRWQFIRAGYGAATRKEGEIVDTRTGNLKKIKALRKYSQMYLLIILCYRRIKNLRQAILLTSWQHITHLYSYLHVSNVSYFLWICIE